MSSSQCLNFSAALVGVITNKSLSNLFCRVYIVRAALRSFGDNIDSSDFFL